MPKRKGICVRSDEELTLQFKQFLSQSKVSNYADGLKYLLTRVGSEIFVEYLACDHFGEYPDNSKHFLTCDKSGKKVIRKREDCQACAHYKIVRVPMQRKEKIEQEIVKLEYRSANLTTEINEVTKQLKNIENLASMPEQLKEKDKEIAKLRKDAEKQRLENAQYIDYLNSLIPIETNNNFHSVEDTVKHREPLQTSQQIPEKAVERRLVNRITEKETKEKTTEIFQQPQEPKIPSEDLQIECPDTKKRVSFKDICTRTCEKFQECPIYLQTYKEISSINKALGKQ